MRTVLNGMLPVLDVTALTVAFVLGYQARNALDIFDIPLNPPTLMQYAPTLILHVGTTIMILYASRLYHLPRAISRIDQMRNVLGAVTLGSVLAFGLQALILTAVLRGTQFQVDYPRSLFVYAWLFSLVLVEAGRELHRILRTVLRRRGIDNENLLIIGTGKIARDITSRIKKREDLGYNLVGVVTTRKHARTNVAGVPVIGEYNDIPDLIDYHSVEQVIIALPEAQRTELINLITMCQRGHVDIKVYPDMFAYMAGDLNVDELGGTPLITVRDIALRGWKLSLKRGMDFFGALLGMVFFSPMMLLTALLIRLESQGPIFYIQERMGLDGRPFPMIKFRSMGIDAEASGPGWTVAEDPRRTHLGRIMRRTNWDEMPQLINVLLGHMSLVGPRPERPVYVREFRDQIPRYMERHREKAGMTGWAQVNGLRGDTSIADRTSYDLWYIENWSLWLDIKIILRTFMLLILRKDKNAY
ncbi:MAG: undecaprenyl-phosphate glucose phosphotransferase [Anaerolineae bacterium]|nr:undecaprenyl-phosphate glucose phosphotransferase [Anaerolineae bacterium]